MNAIHPNFRATIPSTAGLAPFTPLSLDPLERLKRALPPLEQQLAEAESDIKEIIGKVGFSTTDISEAEAALATINEAKDLIVAEIGRTRAKLEAEAKALPPPPVFLIKIPSSLEREQINSRLIQFGLTSINQEQIRSSLIEALYEVEWSKEIDLAPNMTDEDYAEEQAGFLDSVWQREKIQGDAFEEWRQQETERVLDQTAGAPKRDANPMPIRLITVRDEAKTNLLTQRLLETARMRKIVAKQIDFSRRNAIIIVRINLRGVDSPVLPAVTADPLTDAMREEDVQSLREKLDEVYGPKLGTQAWTELVTHIDQLYRLDEFEVGNSDSPLEKQIDPTGSIAPSGDTETSGGPLTASNIEALPAAASETTIAKSSDSISEHAASTGITSQMGEA